MFNFNCLNFFFFFGKDRKNIIDHLILSTFFFFDIYFLHYSTLFSFFFLNCKQQCYVTLKTVYHWVRKKVCSIFFYLWKHVAYPQIIGARRKLTDRTHIERYQTSAPKQNLCSYKMTNNSRPAWSYHEKLYSYLDYNIEFNTRDEYIYISVTKNEALWSKIVLFSFESK